MSEARKQPYASALREHLVRYKTDVLRQTESGKWRNGREYDHILLPENRGLNILTGIREEFWKYFEDQEATARKPAKLHRDFAHLNSSQALAFNLFFPFLESSRRRREILLSALGFASEVLAS